MDPFRFHEMHENMMSGGEDPSTIPVAALLLMLPEKPGGACDYSGYTDNYIIKTRSECTGQGTHVITSLVLPKHPTSPRAILGPRSCGATRPAMMADVSDPSNHSSISSWELQNYQGSPSVGSSPPNSLSQFSTSPSSSIIENGWRPMSESRSRASSVSSLSSLKQGPKFCSLCKKNGEMPSVYKGHQLHTLNGNGYRVVDCPILRRVICPVCQATGDNAHTLSHCPLTPNRPPVALMVKNTLRQGNGSVRRKHP